MYVIGIDFGSTSCRALVVDARNGDGLGTAVADYPHGVMSAVPGGADLGHDWALQDPDDWLSCMTTVVQDALQHSGIDRTLVRGIGIDATACTVVPVTSDGRPLCAYSAWKPQPHAWPKLWKHHAAQAWATRAEEAAAAHGINWLDQFGGSISSEWLWPKAAQIAAEAPEVWQALDDLVDLADWLTWQLTGSLSRSACCAGYKACWDDERGYPAADWLAAIHPALPEQQARMASPLPLGAAAGQLTAHWAEKFGVSSAVTVAVGVIDAHAAVPAAGPTSANVLVSILGTSSCDMVCSPQKSMVPGMSGVVLNGILPDCFGYEAGQACFGDHFAWFENFFAAGFAGHDTLMQQAAAVAPGATGLLCLDWWNGNRSTLQDSDLTGSILGLHLQTTQVDLYRALIEGLVMGKRAIVEAFVDNGVQIDTLVVTGGIADRNPVLLQALADALQRPVGLVRSEQGCALGAAIHGAVAAQVHPDFDTASQRMGGQRDQIYQPNPASRGEWDALYACYQELYEHLGTKSDVLKKLCQIKKNSQCTE